MKKTCNICGKDSGMFPVCKECSKKATKCNDCGAWYLTDKSCKCKTVVIDNDKPISKCILCTNDSNNYLFCKECYYKYKNKTLFLQITNCTEITLKDISYEGKHTCEDGHIVKSKSEMAIDDYLYRKEIKHAYEKEIRINLESTIKPDFYLQKDDIYIEHWGIEGNKSYNESKSYKIEQYKKLKKTVICTYEKDMSNPSSNLDFKLANYKKDEINFL